MSKKESSISQTMGSSMLSAEAESFVPGGMKGSGSPPGAGPGLHQTGAPHGPGPGTKKDSQLTPQQLRELPHYLTSCYPFVRGENSSHSRPNHIGNWQRPGRPPTPQHGGRMPSPQNFPYPFPRGPPPRNYRGHSPTPRNMYAGGSPRTMSPVPRNFAPSPGGIPHNPPGLIGHPVPGIGPLSPPPDNTYIPYLNGMGLPLGAGAVWSPPSEFPSQYPNMQYLSYPYSGAEWGNTLPKKSSEHKKKKKAEIGSNMVSVGIQNESGVGQNSNSKKKAKPKTLICKNADTQTDFSDEIANLTLADQPCPLFNKDNRNRSWLHYAQESSTDSEEKDSDSGYSSPLHRRNQANNGTQPVVGITPYCPQVIPGQFPHQPMNIHIPPGPQLQNMYHPPYAAVVSVPDPYHGVYPMMGHNTISGYPPMGYRPPQPNQNVPMNFPRKHSIPKHESTVSSIATTNQTAANVLPGSSSNQLLSRLGTTTEQGVDDTSKKKKRRSRHKKPGNSSEEAGALSDDPYDLRRAQSSSNVSRTSTVENDMTLHFDDEDEFPNLLNAAGGLPSSTNSQSSGPISYSDILKNHLPSRSLGRSVSSADKLNYTGGSDSQSTASDFMSGKETKNSRKRRKRREMASKAADAELAEISLEQSVLKELRTKSMKESNMDFRKESKTPPPQPKAQPPGKKSKQPISLNLTEMITALEKQQEQEKARKEREPIRQNINKVVIACNPLDSSAPTKRGKEREVPKIKKPSPLKKVILKEREEKKRLRLLEESHSMSPDMESTSSSQLPPVSSISLDSDLSQDALSSKTSSMDYMGTPVSAELSPISQTSPISMSPLSGSPLSSGVNSPIAGNHIVTSKPNVLMKIHSRRFREYCNQVLDKDIDACCTALLQDLVRFQDRLYHKDPAKAKAKRRIVLGLREVTKHLKLNRIKCVIISPNMERIQSKGGLDEALNNILDLCSEKEIPFVFALGRRALGRACAKLVPVSVAGVFNYEGSEENYRGLMKLSEKARSQYKEMVTLLEKELEDAKNAPQPTNTTSTIGGFTQLFPHLGHSRTPSACSAISFTSSILSEPISENYPHSEPETDSRGYEIIRDQKKDAIKLEQAIGEMDDDDLTNDDSLQSSQEKVVIVESLDDIGHEADNEDDDEDIVHNRRKRSSNSCAVVSADESRNEGDEGSYSGNSDNSDANSIIENDLVEELPHIDSIHSIQSDPNIEILSQHSTKTLEMSAEVLSTHSSKTLDADRGGRVTPDRQGKSSSGDLRGESNTTGSGGNSRLRTVDNQERVQLWVADTQKQFECNRHCSDGEDTAAVNGNVSSDDLIGENNDDNDYIIMGNPLKDLTSQSKDVTEKSIQSVDTLALVNGYTDINHDANGET